MKRIIALFLIVIFTVSLASCGGTSTPAESAEDTAPVSVPDTTPDTTPDTEEPSNRLDKTAASLTADLPGLIDLSDTDCLTKADDTLGQLEFIYGVSGENLENIDDYFVTRSHRSTDARAVAVIFFKEGTDSAVIEDVKGQIREIFVKNLVNYTANYDPEQSKIAAAASFKLYDNALAFASYDTEGNTAVFDAIEK